jgi:hypothetical protein
VIAGYTWFRVVVGTVQEQMQNQTYSQTSFEQMADNFAARFGYGRQLLTALEKLHGHLGNIETSKGWMTFISLSQFIYFAGGLTATVMMAMTGAIPLALLAGLFSFAVLRFSGDDVRDYTYDELKFRYKRIRNEYVEMLKSLKLPKDKLQLILTDIERMDRAIQETHKFDTVLRTMANFIFKSARDADASITEQKLLEELAFNDFFVKAAQIKAA